MPRFDGSSWLTHSTLMAPIANPNPTHARHDRSRRIRINVGGKIFETTPSTVQRAGSGSLLGQIAATADGTPTFVDRDPDLFSILLSVIRTGNLPASSDEFTAEEIIEEARFYGTEELLKSAMAPPPLDGIDMENTRSVVPRGRDLPSVFASGSDGSVWVSHGNKITVYDWALRRQGTTLTEFDGLDCLHRLGPTHAVGGSVDFPGLAVYDVVGGRRETTVVWRDWKDPRIYDATVRSVCSSADHIFASFESRRGENAIVLVDKQTLLTVSEIGRETGNSTRVMSAKKLEWLGGHNLLLASAVRGSAFGYAGYVRLWDVRSGTVVWELNEPSANRDCLADVTAGEEWSAIFKVSIRSGEVAMADLRRLGGLDPWVALEETNPSLAKGDAGVENKLSCYGKQIFCSRGGEVEVWSSTPLAGMESRECLKTIFRRNFVGHATEGIVSQMEVGGDRMFILRKGSEEIEVWESRRRMRREKVAQIHPL